MIYRLAVEDVEPGHWVAYALDLPGCFSSGRTLEEAVEGAPDCISAHLAWLAGNGRTAASPAGPVAARVVETFRSFVSQGDYLVNAFFGDDRRPLVASEAEEGLWLLDCSRRDLLAVVQPLPPERLGQPIPGEVQGSIAGILDHVAWAEWWYFDRLGLAFERTEMPADPLSRLEKVRAQTRDRLPGLVGDGRVVERVGELWSARKVLRRALCHERDHTWHIGRLAGESAPRQGGGLGVSPNDPSSPGRAAGY